MGFAARVSNYRIASLKEVLNSEKGISKSGAERKTSPPDILLQNNMASLSLPLGTAGLWKQFP